MDLRYIRLMAKKELLQKRIEYLERVIEASKESKKETFEKLDRVQSRLDEYE